MRVDADRTPDIWIRLGDTKDTLEPSDPSADGDHRPDSGILGALNGVGPVFVEDIKIEMAVAVDKHRRVCSTLRPQIHVIGGIQGFRSKR